MSTGDGSENTAIRITGLAFAGLGLIVSILLLLFGGEGLHQAGPGRRLERLGLPNWMILTGILLLCAAAIIAIVVTWAFSAERRARAAAAAEPGTLPIDAADAEHDGFEDARPGVWVRLGRTDWLVVSLVAAPFIFGAWFFAQVVSIFGDSGPGRVPVWIGAFAVALVAAFFLARRRVPDVWVDVAARRLRAGGIEMDWTELTSAEFMVATVWSQKRRSLVLMLRGTDGVRVPLVLVRRGVPVMRGADAALARRVIAGSSITVPRAEEDPEGKFSRYNFPANVSKEAALAVVARPPRAEDPLPILQ